MYRTVFGIKVKKMKKSIKILSIVAVAIMLIFAVSMSIAAIDSNDPYNSSYSLSISRETENTVMERFKSAILSGSSTVNLSGLNVSTNDADELFMSFLFDNPRYSFMCYTTYTYSYQIGVGGTVLTNFSLNYKWTPSNYQTMLNEIDTEVNNICMRISPNWSDIQKILWVNDYICDVYQYDYSVQATPPNPTPYDDLYSMVHYKTGTCQGYTKLFKAIMDKLGIECSYSSSDMIAHVWNIVKLDGQWYHIDVTWNDNISTRGRILLSNDTNSYKEHAKGQTFATVTDAVQKFACTSTKYNNYFWTTEQASGYGFEGTSTAYAFDINGNFKRYNLSDGTSETLFTKNDKWAASSTGGGYWTGYFGDVLSMGDVMFYSTSKEVYSYNTSTGVSTKIYGPSAYYIYAILYDGTNIYIIDYNYNINLRPLNMSIYYFPAPSVSSTYTVTWKNYDGSTLETDQNVAFGSTPSYNGSTPTKAADAEYTYTFAGWSPTVSSVTGDVTYTATFNQTKNKYTITWKNWDGTTLKTEQKEYGTTPSYSGTPTKQSDGQYSYTFAGWSPTVSQVTGDATYTATFNQTKLTYTITWKNYDGTTLKTDTGVEYGTTPSYNGATPTRASTAEYTYTFTGWTPTISSVTKNATYMATFSATKRSYTVTWKNWDGTILKTDTVEFGKTPSYSGATPSRASDSQYNYSFKGWTPSISPVSGETAYVAEFTQTPKSVETTTEQTVTETTTVETTTESTTETTTETTEKETTTETTPVETTTEKVTETTTEVTTKETTETTEIVETTEVIETTEVTETTEVVETTEATETTETSNVETETTVQTTTESSATETTSVKETTSAVETTGATETTATDSTEETTVEETETTTKEIETTTNEVETTTEKEVETKPQETTGNNQGGFDFLGFVNNVIEKIKEGNVVYIAVTAAAGLVVLGLLILILKAIFRKKK